MPIQDTFIQKSTFTILIMYHLTSFYAPNIVRMVYSFSRYLPCVHFVVIVVFFFFFFPFDSLIAPKSKRALF